MKESVYSNRPKKSEYIKVDHVIGLLTESFKEGFKLFNVYHFRNSDDLVIQLKNGTGKSKRYAIKCTFPVYRFPIKQLPYEDNIFKSLYFISKNSCKEKYVTSDIINMVGKLDSDTKRREGGVLSPASQEIKEYFHPEEFLTYNVLRPEYYVSTRIPKDFGLTFEETRICSFDIEIASDGGKFPEPKAAPDPIALATIFDFNTFSTNVFYLDGYNIDANIDNIRKKITDSIPNLDIDIVINLNKFTDEVDMIKSIIDYLNNNYDIVAGWNVNEFDFAYIINRSKQFQFYPNFNIVYDGFSPAYVFDNFFCVDYISVFKFFVKKNSASMKLNDVAKEFIGVEKIQSETFLDTAYNIGDTILVYMMEKKLNLINQMFSFKENGALLHVFNVRNALEPLFIKYGNKYESVFIGNQYTNYYNIYYNEVYKIINRDILKLNNDELSFYNTSFTLKNIITFLRNIKSKELEPIIQFYMKAEKEKVDNDKEDTAGVTLSKMVEKVFKKRKKKTEDDEVDISGLSIQKSFDIEKESIDEILIKLYGLNINTIYGYPGAFNKSFRGVSKDVIDLDFFSMYPCIIYGLNISFETGKFLAPFKLNILKVYDNQMYENYVNSQKQGKIPVYNLRNDKFFYCSVDELNKEVYTEDSIIANNGMIFCKKIGIIPTMCEHFLSIRAKYKDLMKSETDPVAKAKHNIYQLLYKVYNNSIYGYMGYKYSVLFNRLLVSAVTVMGRSEILFANYMINTYIGNDRVEQ